MRLLNLIQTKERWLILIVGNPVANEITVLKLTHLK